MITLKTLHQSSQQEVFDQVATHLLTQNRKSEFSGTKTCVYRFETKDGSILKCAAGCLIGDDEYSENFEDKIWATLVSLYMVPYEHNQLIMGLQKIHDKSLPELWRDKLRILARKYNLSTDVISGF